jgi:hypothetical protein
MATYQQYADYLTYQFEKTAPLRAERGIDEDTARQSFEGRLARLQGSDLSKVNITDAEGAPVDFSNYRDDGQPIGTPYRAPDSTQATAPAVTAAPEAAPVTEQASAPAVTEAPAPVQSPVAAPATAPAVVQDPAQAPVTTPVSAPTPLQETAPQPVGPQEQAPVERAAPQSTTQYGPAARAKAQSIAGRMSPALTPMPSMAPMPSRRASVPQMAPKADGGIYAQPDASAPQQGGLGIWGTPETSRWFNQRSQSSPLYTQAAKRINQSIGAI